MIGLVVVIKGESFIFDGFDQSELERYRSASCITKFAMFSDVISDLVNAVIFFFRPIETSYRHVLLN